MFFVSLIFFIIQTFKFLDPDFGWHLQAGNLILNSGISKFDPFSYTMPSFSFVNHEWLYDLIIARIFSISGIWGLSFLFALLGVLIIYLVTRGKSLKIVDLIITILAVTSLEPMFTVSPRVISWLLFSLILYINLNDDILIRYKWTLPLIILLWTNLHGTFILGLVILGIISFVKKEFLVFLTSSVITLVNPYGIKLWWMVWLTIADTTQKTRIAEWQPTPQVLAYVPFLVFFIFTLSLVVLIKYWHKFKAEEMILYILFLIFALLAFRNINYWILVTLPMISTGINYFYKDMAKVKNGQKRLQKALNFILISIIAMFLIQLLIHSHPFNENTFYPKNAVNYLKNNIPNGQIFAEYNWGGYLIWKLPEKKVFISGLMPVWKNPNAPQSESTDAMQDYLNITTGKVDYKKHFEKYNIDLVLLANNNSQAIKLRENLEKDGWKIIYKDLVATIYQE